MKTATCANHGTPPPASLRCRVTPERHGCRLDAALEALFPGMGLRGRRRLWEQAEVLVNGIPRAAGFTVSTGDEIQVRFRAATSTAAQPAAPVSSAASPLPVVLPADHLPTGLFCLYKPAGLHSAALAGRDTPSLEALLPHLTPPLPVARPADACLCNRLDGMTSGIVVAARDAHARRAWLREEDAGTWHKFYLTLVQGTLSGEQLATRALDTARRATTRVCNADAPQLRHTRFTPLAHLRSDALAGGVHGEAVCGDAPCGLPLTLVLCCIHKGARHQIRAHAASLGHPLWGDLRYGGTPLPAALAARWFPLPPANPPHDVFFLHHTLLCSENTPPALCVCSCPWAALLPTAARERMAQKILALAPAALFSLAR